MSSFSHGSPRRSFRFGPGLLLLVAILGIQLIMACKVGASAPEAPPERAIRVRTDKQLRAALDKQGVAPGTTILLAAGTYAGTFTSELTCTPEQPCTIRPEPGASARIDGGLTIKGGYTTWRDLEITNTSWTTRQGDDLPQNHSMVEVFGPGVKLINNVVHDLAGGIYGYNASSDNIWYGNVVFNNGYRRSSGSGVGHAFYIQNESGTKRIADNVLVNQYNYGMHAYGSSQASLKHLLFDGNIQLNNYWLIGGGSPALDIHARGNLLYNSEMQFGYGSQLNEDAEISGNYIVSARLNIHGWKNLDVRRNTIVRERGTVVDFKYPTPLTATQSVVWTDNTYYGSDPTTIKLLAIDGEAFYSFPGWQARTGTDKTSTLTAALPAENAVFVRPNEYDPERATIAIYNWQNQSEVSVDLSSLNLKPGQNYRLRNAQNYLNEWRTFTNTGDPVAIPMSGWTVATPYGASAPLADSTFPRFGAFVLEPAASSDAVNLAHGRAAKVALPIAWR